MTTFLREIIHYIKDCENMDNARKLNEPHDQALETAVVFIIETIEKNYSIKTNCQFYSTVNTFKLIFSYRCY